MTATRQHDEALLTALKMMTSGSTLSRAAEVLGKDSSNLGKSLKAVLRDDLELSGDDPRDVIIHYPDTLSIVRKK